MTCGRERLEEVIGMRKIGYPVGEKVNETVKNGGL